ncbi:hypothetical protein [Sphingomonas sp. HMP6]|uniref:hypothetical protein n=1 Tax=Sphingomonas sp. HMP6 TaxID=1517551 RepID=UPI001596E16A|nr:hypothetical protein [Sphingomonas sp. HMP6]
MALPFRYIKPLMVSSAAAAQKLLRRAVGVCAFSAILDVSRVIALRRRWGLGIASGKREDGSEHQILHRYSPLLRGWFREGSSGGAGHRAAV